jgi:hypothetical protein
MWVSFLSWIKTRAILLGAAAVGLLAAIATIRRGGKQAARIEHFEQTIKNVRKKDEVTQKVERMPSGDAADRLRDKWSRD